MEIIQDTLFTQGNKNDTQILTGDCRLLLPDIADKSVHMVLTDPPYFLDLLDADWKGKNIQRSNTFIGRLPIGMHFDAKQGQLLQEFMAPVCEQLFRVLVPGGFLICFSQPRLYHRMALSVELAGFEIRDMITWNYTNNAPFKAFSMNHVVNKMDISDDEKQQIIDDMTGWKTPQLRPQFEPMVLAQKPREGTFVNNWLQYGVGLMNAEQKFDNKCPSNTIAVEKSKTGEHLTVKPVVLLKHLIQLLTQEGQTVLDPFFGSGSTGVAAIQTNRKCIGIEIDAEYVEIAKHKLEQSCQP